MKRQKEPAPPKTALFLIIASTDPSQMPTKTHSAQLNNSSVYSKKKVLFLNADKSLIQSCRGF